MYGKANMANANGGDIVSMGEARAQAVVDATEIGVLANHQSATGAAGAIAPSLAAGAGRLNYCTGFEITFGGATGASLVAVTLTGVKGGTQNFVLAVPAGAAVGGAPLIVAWRKPLEASAINTAITLSIPSLGAGNTNVAANLHGFSIEAT